MSALWDGSDLVTIIGVAFLTGCVSGLIAGSGKSYSHLEDPKVKASQIRKELGDPIYSRNYRPAKRINETGEYRDRAAETPGFRPVVESEESGSGFSYGENRVTALCEVYNPHGWYAERHTQAYGMIGAMTLGIGDVAMIPSTLAHKGTYMQKGIFVTFWYDANDNYVATFHGDISAPRRKASDTNRNTAANKARHSNPH